MQASWTTLQRIRERLEKLGSSDLREYDPIFSVLIGKWPQKIQSRWAYQIRRWSFDLKRTGDISQIEAA